MDCRANRDRFRRRFGIWAILLTGLLAVAGTARSGVEETELTVAYLYNFSKFVRWPSGAFTGPGAPLRICAYGRVSMSGALETLNDKKAQGHQVRVERRKRGEALGSCHVIYVGDSERRYLSPLLRSLTGRPALTVSAIPGFAAGGGMIGFVKVDNRLRFEINTASTEAAGLTVSSQLLKLATLVVRDGKP